MPDVEDSMICEAYDRAMRPKIPDNLLHLVQNSKKEIERNRLQAMIRLKNNSAGGKLMMELISDHFYAVHDWPSYAIKILLSPDFTYHKRLGLACFMVGNGLFDADLGERIFKFYNKHWHTTPLDRRFILMGRFGIVEINN